MTCQEGMNPVVINSGDQRKILNSGDKASIKNGDILELIPGSHYFKYLTTNNQRDCDVFSKVNEGGSVHTNFAVVRKRARENLNPGSSEEHMVVLYYSNSHKYCSLYLSASILFVTLCGCSVDRFKIGVRNLIDLCPFGFSGGRIIKHQERQSVILCHVTIFEP